MDERDLLREIKDYAQELSRVADQHHSDRSAEDVGSISPARSMPNRLRRSVLVTVVLVTVLAAGAIAAVVTVDRSSTPRHAPRAPNSAPSKSADETAAQLAAGAWSLMPAAPISTDRGGASVVWTGHELIVWGGTTGRNDQLRADGAAYNPSTHTWRVLPASPLSARVQQASVWTGSELVIWGGYDNESDVHLHATADGAAYSPATNTWQVLPLAPISARVEAVAVWTGAEVVLLGGRTAISTPSLPSYPDGAAYNPTTRTWRHIDPPAAPNHDPVTWRLASSIGGDRVLAWSVWAKSEVEATNGVLSGADLFLYNDATNRWTSLANAPGALANPQEVLWTGTDALVRGQIEPYQLGDGPGPNSETTARYDPATISWTAVAADVLVNSALHSAWTGQALFSYADNSNGPSDASVYDPASDAWTQLSRTPGGCGGAPTWAGNQVLIVCAGLAPPGASGLAYTAAQGSTTSRSTTPTPQSGEAPPIPFVEEGSLTAPRTYRAGNISLLPPPKGTQPHLTARVAFERLTGQGSFPWKGTPPTAHMILAEATISDFGQSGSDGTVIPFIDHRLAWVAIYTHVPTSNLNLSGGAGPTGGAGPAGTTTVPALTTTSGTSNFTVLVFLDATTGAVLDSQGTTAA